ncbi:unnamed protein product [Pedinophyceae sp. YPF-701]|nr:unnamed protein product [Pedinophyceae sp. YPF-701]
MAQPVLPVLGVLGRNGPGGYVGGGGSNMAAYLRRLTKPKQMDLQYNLWIMWQLVVSPRTAYRHVAYHKQTKNQWARDDPAFLAICCVLQAVSAAAWCLAFSSSFLASIWLVASAVTVDFLGLGCVVATVGWYTANRYLKRRAPHKHAVDSSVEWLYAFDVHCNSWLPTNLILSVLQLLLCPLLLRSGTLPVLLSLLLHGAAAGYYFWLTFLGYSTLPFLERSRSIVWWPAVAFVGVAPVLLLTGVNLTKLSTAWFFKGQV